MTPQQHTTQLPPPPSIATLLQATAAGTFLATLLLLFVILPAEYNIDPTGVGDALGLTKLSAPNQDPPPLTSINPTSGRKDGVTLEVLPGKGIEYKLGIKSGSKVQFEWKTDGQPLFFDFHGEPKGDTKGTFESFTVGTSNTLRGTFTAPFDGSHGWYWKNTTSSPIIVTLTTAGTYQPLGVR